MADEPQSTQSSSPAPTAPSGDDVSGSGDAAAPSFEGMQVYNPVDESYDNWTGGAAPVADGPHDVENGGGEVLSSSPVPLADGDAIKYSSYDEWKESNNKNVSNGDGNGARADDGKDGEVLDLDDPDLIASQKQLLEAASKSATHQETQAALDDDADDDALARAIAEQDVPPGVSAAEQQEVMMRLLTQQLRRGDWDGAGEELSPALEQRLLRDFQMAQRKRRETYGNERLWGILGLYDHLGESLCILLV